MPLHPKDRKESAITSGEEKREMQLDPVRKRKYSYIREEKQWKSSYIRGDRKGKCSYILEEKKEKKHASSGLDRNAATSG